MDPADLKCLQPYLYGDCVRFSPAIQTRITKHTLMGDSHVRQ